MDSQGKDEGGKGEKVELNLTPRTCKHHSMEVIMDGKAQVCVKCGLVITRA